MMDLRTKCQFSPQLGTLSCMNIKSVVILFLGLVMSGPRLSVKQ